MESDFADYLKIRRALPSNLPLRFDSMTQKIEV